VLLDYQCIVGISGVGFGLTSKFNSLTLSQYKEMSEGLAMDEVLTDVARRLFLERLVCPDMAA
jgi:hypothetical protein